MHDIVWRPRAVVDLDAILSYIILEHKSPNAAESCGEAIMAAIESVAEFPESGWLFIDDDLKRPYRRVLAKNYWIYYSCDPRKPHGSHDPHAGGAITVWRIFHTTQDHDAYGFAFLDED